MNTFFDNPYARRLTAVTGLALATAALTSCANQPKQPTNLPGSETPQVIEYTERFANRSVPRSSRKDCLARTQWDTVEWTHRGTGSWHPGAAYSYDSDADILSVEGKHMKLGSIVVLKITGFEDPDGELRGADERSERILLQNGCLDPRQS